MALLVEGELFAQEEIFCCQGGRWTQTQQPEAHDIPQKSQQRASQTARSDGASAVRSTYVGHPPETEESFLAIVAARRVVVQ
jgi:hypothetical protein